MREMTPSEAFDAMLDSLEKLPLDPADVKKVLPENPTEEQVNFFAHLSVFMLATAAFIQAVVDRKANENKEKDVSLN